MTSNGLFIGMTSQNGEKLFPLLWDSKIASDVSIQKLTDILSGDFNDFYSGVNSMFPNGMCDYYGLHRSFNKMDIYLRNTESKFSGVFLDLSGSISIPTTIVNAPYTTVHSSYGYIYTTSYGCNLSQYGSIAIDIPSGISLSSFHNYRGKDFYMATVWHSTSDTAFDAADAFNTMKSGVEKVLVNDYKISGIENHYSFLSYGIQLPGASLNTGNLNLYEGLFLYKKNKKVIPSSNATFNLYRVDHDLQIKTHNAGGPPDEPINSVILGAAGVAFPIP